MQEYEKLGLFYLGRPVDPQTQKTGPTPLLYDSRDLVTHAAIVGMTGSGKTGLGIGLLEEATMDGVPALVLDPKGDLADLLLTFPELRSSDFEPWVRAEDAERKGRSRAEHAAAEAEKWRQGLAAWDQDGERIRRLRAACDVALYTPGSDLGTPVSILASLAAPPAAVVDDGDLFRDRVEIAATSLLSLAGLDVDPLRSREHILVSTILGEAWKAGRDLDLAALISALQKPPVSKIGVLDLESFFPADDRFGLAMRLNNLLAAPGFDVWLRGAPLAVDQLLYTADGRPRLAVISLAHLSEAERMFFVSLLLNETIAWIRSKPGTSSLRAMLYMDEVFGYLPPVANPPSKKPMLKLLKQARAYGLGVALATQNPVDLDYKALSNIGTWFLGRLQTERDKARVLDGLEGASAASGEKFDRATVDRLLSGLRARVFLLHNVHEEAPVLFETRWVMSYLAGPLDREGIRRLASSTGTRERATSVEDGGRSDAAPEAATESAGSASRDAASSSTSLPILPPAIGQVFLPFREGLSPVVFEPALLGIGRVFVEDAKRGVSETIDCRRVARFGGAGGVDWLEAEEIDVAESELEATPIDGARFAELPGRARQPESYAKWRKDLESALYRTVRVTLWKSPSLGELSRTDETERDFRIRLDGLARERRDAEVDAIRDRFASKHRAIDDRIRRAEAKVESEKQEASANRMSTVLAGAASIAGMLLGRRRITATSVRSVGTAVRSFGRSQKQAGDVGRAEESLEALVEQRKALEREIEESVAEVTKRFAPATETLDPVEIKPRKSDVEVRRVVLAWLPKSG